MTKAKIRQIKKAIRIKKQTNYEDENQTITYITFKTLTNGILNFALH